MIKSKGEGMKNRRKKQKINSKTVDLHRTISIITFEIKGPDTLHYKQTG